jgi:hypothetical protein
MPGKPDWRAPPFDFQWDISRWFLLRCPIAMNRCFWLFYLS